jgi:hypothetical protein
VTENRIARSAERRGSTVEIRVDRGDGLTTVRLIGPPELPATIGARPADSRRSLGGSLRSPRHSRNIDREGCSTARQPATKGTSSPAR